MISLKMPGEHGGAKYSRMPQEDLPRSGVRIFVVVAVVVVVVVVVGGVGVVGVGGDNTIELVSPIQAAPFLLANFIIRKSDFHERPLLNAARWYRAKTRQKAFYWKCVYLYFYTIINLSFGFCYTPSNG